MEEDKDESLSLLTAEQEDKSFIVQELVDANGGFAEPVTFLPDGRMFVVLDEELFILSVDDRKMQLVPNMPSIGRLYTNRGFFGLALIQSHRVVVRVNAATMTVMVHELADNQHVIDMDVFDSGRVIMLTSAGRLYVWDVDNSIKQGQVREDHFGTLPRNFVWVHASRF